MTSGEASNAMMSVQVARKGMMAGMNPYEVSACQIHCHEEDVGFLGSSKPTQSKKKNGQLEGRGWS